MRSTRYFVILVFAISIFPGCADIERPSAREMVRSPIGRGALELGMSKRQVLSIYGEPDMRSDVVHELWGSSREEWFYGGRYRGLPVGGGFLKDDLYLYFDEDSLTNISREPLGTGLEGERAW